MAAKLDIAFNLTLLQLTPQKLQYLKPVKVLDSFDGTGSNFHEDGLFSTSIFGRVGDEMRSRRFSYIDIKVSVFHPIIYRALAELKQLYTGILSGAQYAVFDPEEGDFVRSDVASGGKTGFQFFVANWRKIKWQPTKSVTREHNIRLIERYGDKCMYDHVVVLPAGLRDMEMLPDGRPQEDEVNTMYRRLLMVANTVSDASIVHNPEVINNTRFTLQKTFNQIYDTYEEMIKGKRKLLQNRWTARRIFNGTRNVITAADTSVPYLGAPGGFTFNDTGVGLYQTLKCILPVTKFLLRNGFMAKVFAAVDQPAQLVNKKTLKREAVSVPVQTYDRWMTDEGVEKVISAFAHEDNRHKVMEIADHYIGLIYKGPDGTFRMMQDIDELPEGRSAADVSPVTFCELLYASTYADLNKYPIFVTRYPVTGIGSIYPSMIYCRTTIKVEVRKELGENWEQMADDRVAYQFPIRGSQFINSLIPHSAKLVGLGADFDGDTCSGNALYTREAVEQVKHFLQTVGAYVNTNGRFMASTNTDTVALVMHNLTGVKE